MASSCENRFCSALDELVGAELAVAADDWLCAASSALMVAGDSCENPLPPEAWVEPAEVAVLALPERSNRFEPWLKPVVCGDDDFDAVSDWKASRTDEAAPRASSIAKTPTNAAWRRFGFTA